MERCKFHQAQQTATETITEFIARLKSLATHCNFADINLAMRDQLVCGLRDHAINAILFREENLTYDNAYKLAVAAEAAEKNATSTDKLQPSATSNSEVHSIKEGQRWRSGQTDRGSNRRRGEGRGQRGTGDSEQVPNKQQPTVPMGTCHCCGGPNHFARHCFHRYKTCTRCKRRGHIETACREGQGSVQQMETKDETFDPEEDGYTSDFLVIESSGSTVTGNAEAVLGNVDITGDNIATGPMTVNVKINDVDVIMEVDTGAYVAAISKVMKERLFPNLKIEKLNKSFNAYAKATLNLVVMTRPGPTLIGRQWLKALGLWPIQLLTSKLREDNVNQLDMASVAKDLSTRFPRLFGAGVGMYNKGTLRLRLKEGSHPVALKARKLPFALTSKVEREIERLVSLGHLEKVDISEWATPIVPIIKKDGSVRICGNFKLTVNPQLEKLDILGYVIDKTGLHKAKDKVRAMEEAPHPTDFKQLNSFIGLITYYARFLPNRAEKLKPLYDCAKQQEFRWISDCDRAFKWVKQS
ncbi:uncharacterized protein [Temnothorax nylanderi]|uniref:uncharacterized protein n=1 Tax=Temnothorax nylanderi TaxID=102681 RepID=UPI003A862FBC